MSEVTRPDGSRTRICPRCKMERDLSSFYSASRRSGFIVVLPDGTRESRDSYCKFCRVEMKTVWLRSAGGKARQAEYQRHWRENGGREKRREYAHSPEVLARRRELYAQRMAKVRQSPKALAAYREQARLYAWERRRRAGVPEHGPRKLAPPIFDELPRLPREPFVAWLDRKEAEYGGPEMLAEVTGINARTIYRIRSGTENQTGVNFDTVDKALQREGSTLMWEIYDESEIPV